MNDLTVPHQSPGLLKVRVDVVTLQGDTVLWTFPVLAGTAREHVEGEILMRISHDPNLDHSQTKITYPCGAWNEPLDRDQPPIGTNPPPKIAPPQGGSGTAPPQRPTTTRPPGPVAPPPPAPFPTGPVPNPAPPQGEQLIVLELEAFLAQWRARHELSSSEYYLHLSRVMAQHAASLVGFERRAQQQRRSQNGQQ